MIFKRKFWKLIIGNYTAEQRTELLKLLYQKQQSFIKTQPVTCCPGSKQGQSPKRNVIWQFGS